MANSDPTSSLASPPLLRSNSWLLYGTNGPDRSTPCSPVTGPGSKQGTPLQTRRSSSFRSAAADISGQQKGSLALYITASSDSEETSSTSASPAMQRRGGSKLKFDTRDDDRRSKTKASRKPGLLRKTKRIGNSLPAFCSLFPNHLH